MIYLTKKNYQKITVCWICLALLSFTCIGWLHLNINREIIQLHTELQNNTLAQEDLINLPLRIEKAEGELEHIEKLKKTINHHGQLLTNVEILAETADIKIVALTVETVSDQLHLTTKGQWPNMLKFINIIEDFSAYLMIEQIRIQHERDNVTTHFVFSVYD